MFALFALAVLSEAGERLFMSSMRYGQPVQYASQVSPQQVVYYDAAATPLYYTQAAVPVQGGRSAVPVMSAVTERDADGNPVVHTEMFDIGWVAITIAFYGAIMLKIAGVF
jgi:uncharacterized protein YijF (DUF1287 family)